MKKTHIFKSVCCILLALILIFSFAGCKKDGEIQPDEETETETGNDSELKIPDINSTDDVVKTDILKKIEFYYLVSFYNTYNTALYYDETYGDGYGKMFTGYDTSLAPDEQNTTNSKGESITFAECFYDESISIVASCQYYSELAAEDGVVLTEENEKEIDVRLAEFKNDSQLTSLFESGFADETLRNIISDQILVERYFDFVREKCGADTDGINAIYEADKAAYDIVAFRWYAIDITSSASGGVYEEESEAAAFIEKVTAVQNYNEETFKKVVLETVGTDNKNYETYKSDQATKIEKIDKDSIYANVSQDAADWLYETDGNGNYVRQTGEIKYFVSSDKTAVYILSTTGTPFRDETKATSVRHILLKDSTFEEAENVLDEYLAEAGNDVDEEFFIELIAKYSDDTGSKDIGGLIDNMLNDGQYVSSFEDWAFSEGEFAGEKREYGTTGIVESEYGYHIMFYAGCDKNPSWYEEIVDELYDDEILKIDSGNDCEEEIAASVNSSTKENIIKDCLEAISKMK